MIEYRGEQFFDDRLYIHEVVRAIIGYPINGPGWAVRVYSNTPSHRFFSTHDFQTREEAIIFLEKSEPLTPRISLGEKSANPVPSIEEHREWLMSINAKPTFIEEEPPNIGKVFKIAEKSNKNGNTLTISDEASRELRWRLPVGLLSSYTAYTLFTYLQDEIMEGNFPKPWAVVVLDRVYDIRSHFSEINRRKLQMRGGCHLDNRPNGISFMYILNKAILEEVKEKSPLFLDSWELLQDSAEDEMWLCLPPPLPQKWIHNMEKGK